MGNFSKKVIAIVAKIPGGKTLTYKQVARLAGSSRAYRAIGNILNKYYNEIKLKSPAQIFSLKCHRVVRSDGKIGGYADGKKLKRTMLRLESKLSDKIKYFV